MKENEDKKKEFLRPTTVKEFQQAEVSRAETKKNFAKKLTLNGMILNVLRLLYNHHLSWFLCRAK